MAPISLKSGKIDELTAELVKSLTGFKKNSKNFHMCVQFALSNFRFHRFLDVDSWKVSRQIKGISEKFKVHSKGEKADDFEDLCESFLNSPLSENSTIPKTDAHYSLLSLLLLLADAPTEKEFTRREKEQDKELEEFDWVSYLLDGEEEPVQGIPHSLPDSAWSDTDEDSENEADSGIESAKNAFHRPTGLSSLSVSSSKEESHEYSSIRELIIEPYWLSSDYSQSQSRCPRASSLAAEWEAYVAACNPFHHSEPKITLTEVQTVRETLWILQGATDSFVYPLRDGKFCIRQDIQVGHLTPACLANVLQKFVDMGNHVLELQNFIHFILTRHEEKITNCRTFQAFVSALTQYFKDLQHELSNIEKSISCQEKTITIMSLYQDLQPCMKEVQCLFNVYENSVSINYIHSLTICQRVCYLLDGLYLSMLEADNLGPAHRHMVRVLLFIVAQTLQPYLDIIEGWLLEGILRDSVEEFCFYRDDSVELQCLAFFENGIKIREVNGKALVPIFLKPLSHQLVLAGKSAGLLQSLDKLGPSDILDIQDNGLYQKFFESLESMFSLDFAGRSLSRKQAPDLQKSIKDQLTNTVSCFSDPVMRKVFANTLSLSLPNADKALADRSGKRAAISAAQTGTVSSEGETGLYPIDVLFKKCFNPNIQSRCTQVCSSLIDLLKNEYNILDHLAVMRFFFLFEAGDVMYHFYTDIFQKARVHDSWQDISFLNIQLQEALQMHYPQHSDKLTVDYTSTASLRKQHNMQSLDGLKLVYKIPWPVNLILDSESQRLYNLVFMFLLQVKRSKWTLDVLRFDDLSHVAQRRERHDSDDDDIDQDPRSSKQVELTDEQRHLIHKMYLLRFKLMQFVNSFHNYIMTRILHSTGLEFQEDMTKVKDLEDIISTHKTYLSNVVDRCLLNNKVSYVREAIMKVMNLAILFQTRWDAGVSTLSIEMVDKMETEFSKCNHFILTFLMNIIRRGTFPYLETLAYSLTSSMDYTIKPPKGSPYI